MSAGASLRGAMPRGLVTAAAVLLVVTGCGHSPEPGKTDSAGTNLSGRSNEELTRFLPVLADYPGSTWSVTVTPGAPEVSIWPRTGKDARIEPSGCADIPFQRKDLIAASTRARVPNPVAGDSGEASVWIMREGRGADLIAESSDWAKRCHDFRAEYGSPDTPDPTAVSLLPPERVNGVEVTRIHLTDNREHRFQPEGSREAVVSLARVAGLVVLGFRHDNRGDAAEVLALTIKRLAAGQPASKPLSDKVETGYLNGRPDRELRHLLPSTPDLPPGWIVTQTSPMVGERATDVSESTTKPVECGRIPFQYDGWRSDTNRDFRDVASVGAGNGNQTGGSVRLSVETRGHSIIEDTKFAARYCADNAVAGRIPIETLPGTQLDGIDVTNVAVTQESQRRTFTASLLNIRGLLVIAEPQLSEQSSPLVQKLVDNIRHAKFDTPPGDWYSGPYDRPAGDVAFPQASADDTDKLARVAQGELVNPEQYHFGGLMPGDTKTRTPDYLHFRSPTGSITCSWHKSVLVCDTPRGTYARTPKPVDVKGDWSDSLVLFGWNGLQNGAIAADPVVYAESDVLDYGKTIRLTTAPGLIECLMERDGLTCVDYSQRTGMHLSRDDLTPLKATDSLAKDDRAEPS